MATPRVQVLRLYRSFLRTAGKCQHKEIVNKLKYNIRDVFEIHQGESDPAEIGALVSAARKDLRTLQMLTKWDKQTWEFGFGKQ